MQVLTTTRQASFGVSAVLIDEGMQKITELVIWVRLPWGSLFLTDTRVYLYTL